MCKDTSNNRIKKFDFPHDIILDESEALQSCEKYCARNSTCWGCSLVCRNGSVTCHSGEWNAIAGCRALVHSEADSKTLTSQKPSKDTMIDMFL